MSFNKITQFGNLTLQNGERVSFKDFDKNNDNVISSSEFEQTIKELELNDVDISQIDFDENSEVSFDEFAKFEQITLMQDYVNGLENSINRDFSGNSIGTSQIRNALIEYINEFAENYENKDISKMANEFKKSLPAKYETLKQQFANDETKSIKSKVLDDAIAQVSDQRLLQYMPDKNLFEEFKNKLLPELRTELDKEAIKYLQTYKGSNVNSDLLEHLNQWLDNNLETLSKELANSIIKAENDKFLSISGFNYMIDPTKIDYSFESEYGNTAVALVAGAISGSTADSRVIYVRGKGWSGSREKAYEEGVKLLNNFSLKYQIKMQIENMLKEKGISFDKIATVFENVYNDSVVKTLNSEDMITGRGARGLSSKGKAYINVKNCVDTFIVTFNNNIRDSINQMNASDTDFDTQDMDYTGLGSGENGENFDNLYKSGENVTKRKAGRDYYVKIASDIIEKLKLKCLAKAKAMFQAKGINISEQSFDAIFNNAKMKAIEAAVSGVGSNFGSWGSAGDVLLTGVIGATTGAAGTITKGAIESGWNGVWKGAAQGAFLGACAMTGPIGWAVGGATIIGSALGSFFASSHHSSSTLNTKTLIDTFMQELKTQLESEVA